MEHYKGSDLTKEYIDFFENESKRIETELIKLGCTNIEFYCRFYSFCGFFTAPNKQKYMLTTQDVWKPYNTIQFQKVNKYEWSYELSLEEMSLRYNSSQFINKDNISSINF